MTAIFPLEIDCAIHKIISLGPENLEHWRNQQLHDFARIEASMRTFNAWLDHRMPIPPHVRPVTRNFRVGTLAWFIDAMIHPDTSLPRRFMLGLQLDGVIEDSQVFRPIPRPDQHTYHQECRNLYGKFCAGRNHA